MKLLTKISCRRYARMPRLRFVMKLFVMFMPPAILQVSAKSYAQRITLTEHKAPLKTVFVDIRKQSGYDFFYDLELIQHAKPVDLQVQQATIEETLDKCLAGQDLVYTINDKIVVIKARAASSTNTQAEAIEVKGKVTDEQGIPLPGVTVSIKGLNRSVPTDKDGLFEVKIDKPGTVLLFTMTGMQSKEVTVNSSAFITVTLKIKPTTLSEVVVNTGYQRVKLEEMTGATTTIGSVELGKTYTPNIIDNIEGKVPGLVNYRGTTTIRGVSTINASQNVLYVVDGLPIEGTIADINPFDVESVTVLKDAAAAAIYGARAANGVIVITTKKARGKRTTIELSSNITITQKPDVDYNLLTPSQQVDLESNYAQFYYLTSDAAATDISKTGTDIISGTSISPVQYAWYQYAQGQISQAGLQDQLSGFKKNNFRQQFKDNALLNGVLQQYNFAVRTDGVKYQSSLVVNYKNDNTGIIDAYNRQLNIFYKGTYQASKWLDIDFGVNNVLGFMQGSNSGFATDPTNVSPYLQLLDNSGHRAYYTTGDYNMYNTDATTQPMYSQLVNHLDELGKDQINTTQRNTRYYTHLNVTILPGLTFSPQFQYEDNVTSTSAYSEADSYIMRYLKSVYTTLLPTNGGKLATTNTTGAYWTARGQAQYRRTFDKHAIDVIGGTEFRQTKYKGTGGLLLGYDDQLQSQSTTSVSYPALYAYNTATAFELGMPTSSLYSTYFSNPLAVIPEATHRFNSNYANATYTYDSRYNAFGSYRVDYADVFGLDKKFRGKPLWSTGLGWNIHHESFMADVNWVNFLKLRATYGVTGNISQGVSSFLTANSTLTNVATNVPVSVVTNAANPQLTWEKTATTNLGIDFTVLNNRMNGSFDWYRKKGTHLLVSQRVDASEGFTSTIINNGDLLNNGLELSVQYNWFKPGRRDGLSWSTTLVASKNINKITYVDETAATPIALVQGGYKKGYPVNALYSFQYKGMNSTGQPQWLKADGTLTTTGLLTTSDLGGVIYSGGRDPKQTIGLTNEIHYKGFSLNVLAVYYGGQYLRAVIPDVYSGVPYGSMPSYLLNSWTPDKPNTLIPGFGEYAAGTYPGTSPVPSQHLTYSDAFVRPGDFIKIRRAVLGYQVPQPWSAKLGSNNIRLSLQLNNPKAVWTKNKVNVDPETGGAPIPTSYVIGLNCNL